ncbi:MAG: ABC transporter permease [Chloroflexota bacterium]|nr:ABC transporter permease [Chloroflexota bacterium]
MAAQGWRFNVRWPLLPAAILVGLVLVAILAPWIAPYSPFQIDLAAKNAPPFWYTSWYSENPDISRRILGADYVGRDLLSRIMHGARISLTVSAIAILAGMLVGSTLGLIAGYFGGLVDEVITRFVDIWLSLPFILIAMVAAIVFGATTKVVMGVLALLAWSVFVRNVRAEVLSLKTRDYVALARVAGASTSRIILRHILPGVINTIVVIATLRVGQLIIAEATLSYLGAGIPSPTPAWGLMVSEGRDYLSTAWWTSLFPGAAIFVLVMAMNFIGDWFRDRMDPRLRQL